MKHSDTRYYAFLIIGILFWSTSFVATKLAYATFPPLTLGVCRFVIALAALAVLFAFRRDRTKPNRRDLFRIYLSGVVGITAYYAMENIGVSLTTAANAALIVSATPAITIVLEHFIYGTPITKGRGLGVALAIFGVYLITSMGGEAGGDKAFWGNIILAAAGVVWAFYNFITRGVVDKYSMTTVSFHQTVAGVATFLPLAFFEQAEWRAPTWESGAVLLYLSLSCSVAAFMLYNYGLRRLSAGTAAIMLNLVPVFGVALSVLVLGEEVYARQLVGGVIVIAGVMLSVRKG